MSSGGCSVEIQIRTLFQDAWAQMVERLGEIIDLFEQMQTSFDVGSMKERLRQRLIDEGRDVESSIEMVNGAENEIVEEWNSSVDEARSRLMRLLSNTARSLDVE